MASPHAGFYINIKAPPGIRIRDERGRYTSAQDQLYRQNKELAQTLQYQVARRMKNDLKRPGVSTGRLVRVTMDPKNRVSDRFFMGVGNEAFLNTSIAKYWRTIEEGSAATWTKRSFTSLPLQGLWGTNLSGFAQGPSGPWVTVAPPYGDGGRGQEMYQPFRVGRGGGPSPLPVFTPKHEIEPQYAYRRVAESPDLNRRLLLQATQFWNRILGAGIQPGGFYE